MGSGSPQVFKASKVKWLGSRRFEGLQRQLRVKVSLGRIHKRREGISHEATGKDLSKPPKNEPPLPAGWRAGHMVWAPGGKAELALTSFKALSACGENKDRGAEGAPEEGLATSREEDEGPGPGGGCQNLRMGVCFGTRANQIADGLYVWEEGESVQSRSSGSLPAHLGAQGKSALYTRDREEEQSGKSKIKSFAPKVSQESRFLPPYLYGDPSGAGAVGEGWQRSWICSQDPRSQNPRPPDHNSQRGPAGQCHLCTLLC